MKGRDKMKFIIGIHNGYDVDDYYIDATSHADAVTQGEKIASNVGGALYTVLAV